MNRHQLELFKVVAEKKNFSHASEILHISQPAISQQIQILEEELGVKLFQRTTRKVSLTDEGKLLYHYAIQICNLFADAEKNLSEFSKVVRGSLTIGASQTIGEYFLPKFIGGFKELYPQVQITIQIFNTQHIAKAVHEQTLDIGLVEGQVDGEDLNIIPFLDDELLVIVHPSHPLAGQKTVDLEQFSLFPFVLREKGSGTRQVMEDALTKAGWDPENLSVVMELGSTEAVKSAVEANLGISVLSARSVQKELQLKTLKALRIADIKFMRKFYIVTSSKKYSSPSMEHFLKYIQTEKEVNIENI
ncbi:MAG: LysR family transcriptional regulator [Clostridia bacterium]|nr:LysR family transcriptional regulator [Clostridia bacterium]